MSKKFTTINLTFYVGKNILCLGMGNAKTMPSYVIPHHTLVSRMDPLKYSFDKPALSGRLAWWHLLLAEFNINYVTQKSIKGKHLLIIRWKTQLKDIKK